MSIKVENVSLYKDSRKLKESKLWILGGLIVVVLAFLLRFISLGYPTTCYFDETYYYYDARDIQVNQVESQFVVHPPLGKWLISKGLDIAGIERGSELDRQIGDHHGCDVPDDGTKPEAATKVEQHDAMARRLAPALFGSLAVLVTLLAGLALFRTKAGAVFAAGLLAIDGLAITMSRISMLDIFVQFFIIAAFATMLFDQRSLYKALGSDPSGKEPKARPWLLLTGLFVGLAMSSKWSAVIPWGLMCLWMLGYEINRMRLLTGKWYKRLFPILVRGLTAMLVIPILVYVFSYVGWFGNWEKSSWAERHPDATCMVENVEPCSPRELLEEKAKAFMDEQKQIYGFHAALKAEHSYRAHAITWLVIGRPVAYYYQDCSEEQVTCEGVEDKVTSIIGSGNPFIWWPALISYGFLIFWTLQRKDWRAGLIVLFVLMQVIPYFLSPRTVFFFYMTQTVPFICMSVAYFAERMAIYGKRWVGALLFTLASVGFAIWAPVWLALPISKDWWSSLMWFKTWI